MRRMMIASAAADAALFASAGFATAQIVIDTPPVGVYVGTPDRDYDAYDARTRVYGYQRYYRYSDDDDTVVVRPGFRPSNCGTYRYWNGDRCVDARR